MGWDSFGLPAENAAIERGIHPAEWTVKNIEIMKEQMATLTLDFDWSKVNICYVTRLNDDEEAYDVSFFFFFFCSD